MSSTLHTYKELVSKVYILVQTVYRREDSSVQFDDFLNHLAEALEHKGSLTDSIHIPPHVEIIQEQPDVSNVVVVKDDDHKNVVIRHSGVSQIVKEDEELETEQNEIVESPRPPSSFSTSAWRMEEKEEEEEEDVEDLAADAAEEAAEEAADEIAQVEEEEQEEEEQEEEHEEEQEEEEEEQEEDDEDEEELEIVTIKRKKYFVAAESKRVYKYVDDETAGAQVGKLENGNLILM